MNILIFSWRGPGHPHAGGAEIATHQHAKAWVKSGHKVLLFTSSFPSSEEEEKINGVEIVRKGTEILGVHMRAFFWYLFGDHPKFDLVVDEFHGIPFFTPLFVRTKKIGWIHEVAKEVWWFNPWSWPFNLIPAIFGTLFERYLFLILYRNIQFMTVSDSTKNDLISWGVNIKNVKVVHNGVSVVKVNEVKEAKKTAVFLGALTKDKGVEGALKVFSLINQIDKNWQFWIVGKGSPIYHEYLKRRAVEFGIAGKVKHWGFVTEKKKFELLARAHLLINPSIREGWGLVNIEANSTGTPVIGYKVPGMVDSVRNGVTGVLVEKGDIKNLALSVLKLINNKIRYNNTRKSAIVWSKKFTWEKSTSESLKLLKTIRGS